MRKIILIILGLLLIFSGCFAPSHSPKKVMLILHAWSSELASEVTKGANAAAKEYDITLFTKAISKEKNTEVQAELIKKAIDENYDAIIIEPFGNEQTWEKIELAKNAGIDVVLVNGYTHTNLQSVNIDVEKLKSLLLDEIKSTQNPNVLILNCVDPYEDTNKMRNIIADALNTNDIFYDNIDFSIYQMTSAINSLQYASNEFNIVLALNEFSSIIAADQLEKNPSKYKLFAFSKTLNVVRRLEKSQIYSICALDYFALGYKALENFAKNDYSNSFISPYLVKSDTLYTFQNQRLIFPV